MKSITLVKNSLDKLNSKQQSILANGLILFAMLATLLFISKFWFLRTHGFVLNVTSSLPQRLWLVDYSHKEEFSRGDYFTFLAPKDVNLTTKSTPLVKKIVGVAGDRVEIKGSTLYINQQIMGHIWTETLPSHHKLYPIASQIIDRGCYFAWTPDLFSYDSRYTDIGIICEKDNRIVGAATPLF
ncbi:S26 family signal peptidase [Aquella oligotrophica]|nr:S26 family signal peptidase [Aquella oligotrophica]